MSRSQTAAAYRAASTEGATQIGLMVVIYDAIAFEIQSAAAAVRAGDIARRCQASNKALLLLGHLQSWVERLEEPQLMAGLDTFYVAVRQRLLQLQSEGEQKDFEGLAGLMLSVRASWQEKEQLLRPAGKSTFSYSSTPLEPASASLSASGWSA